MKLFLFIVIFHCILSCEYTPRILISPDTKEKACKKADSKYKSPEFEGLSSYVDSLGGKESKGQNFIKNTLLNGSTEGLKDFIMELVIYLAFIVIGILLLLCISYYINYSMACVFMLLVLWMLLL